MDLLTLIVVAVLIYIGWTLLKTYRNMEFQLREIQRRCVPAASSGTDTAPLTNTSDADQVKKVTETMVAGLQKMMLAASN